VHFWRAYAHSAQGAVTWIAFALTGLSIAAPVGWSDSVADCAARERWNRRRDHEFWSNQLSGIAAPIVTGFVVAATKNFQWAFLVAAIYLTIGIASYIFSARRITPIPEPEEARK